MIYLKDEMLEHQILHYTMRLEQATDTRVRGFLKNQIAGFKRVAKEGFHAKNILPVAIHSRPVLSKSIQSL